VKKKFRPITLLFVNFRVYSELTVKVTNKIYTGSQPQEQLDSTFLAMLDPVLCVLWMWKPVSAPLWQAFFWLLGAHCMFSHISRLLSVSQSATEKRTNIIMVFNVKVTVSKTWFVPFQSLLPLVKLFKESSRSWLASYQHTQTLWIRIPGIFAISFVSIFKDLHYKGFPDLSTLTKVQTGLIRVQL